jgi:hypothetical protein
VDVGPRLRDDLGGLRQDVAGDAEEIDRILPEQEKADEEGDEQPSARGAPGEPGKGKPRRPRPYLGGEDRGRSGDVMVRGNGPASRFP